MEAKPDEVLDEIFSTPVLINEERRNKDRAYNGHHLSVVSIEKNDPTFAPVQSRSKAVNNLTVENVTLQSSTLESLSSEHAMMGSSVSSSERIIHTEDNCTLIRAGSNDDGQHVHSSIETADDDEKLSASSSKKTWKHSQFTCGHCQFTSLKPHVMKKHYKQNHRTGLLYLCEPCFFVSHNKYTYQTHWKSHHFEDPKKLMAPISLEFLDEDNTENLDEVGPSDTLSEHDELVIHSETNYNNYLSSQSNHPIKCKYCSFKTAYSSHMKSHVSSLHCSAVCETLVNMADDTRTYRCITCDTISVSKQAASNHYVSKHVNFPAVRCELCDVNLKDKSNLYGHLKTERHREFYRRSLRCPNCQFATLSKKALQKHRATKHKISKPGEFACDKCTFVGDFKKDLSIHTKRVHGLKKDGGGFYRCEECDFKSTNKDKFLHHTKTSPNHSLAKNCVRCEVCHFAAVNAVGLLNHKRSIHGKHGKNINC